MIKTLHEGEELTEQTFRLNEHEFVGCEFVRCTLIYGGEPLNEVKMVGCSLQDVKFGFVDAASASFQFLSSMYNQSPKLDDPIKILIEHLFIGIRTGHIFKVAGT